VRNRLCASAWMRASDLVLLAICSRLLGKTGDHGAGESLVVGGTYLCWIRIVEAVGRLYAAEFVAKL
jgi:hypothetical protein